MELATVATFLLGWWLHTVELSYVLRSQRLRSVYLCRADNSSKCQSTRTTSKNNRHNDTYKTRSRVHTNTSQVWQASPLAWILSLSLSLWLSWWERTICMAVYPISFRWLGEQPWDKIMFLGKGINNCILIQPRSNNCEPLNFDTGKKLTMSSTIPITNKTAIRRPLIFIGETACLKIGRSSICNLRQILDTFSY